MDRGYVKLFRRIREHELWKEKPFTRGQAWVDMIMSADYETHILEASQRFLAARWGWTHKKVRAFLKYLVRNKMIDVDTRGAQAGAQVGAQIKVLNYYKFHDQGAQVKAQVGAQNEEVKEYNTKRQQELDKGIIEMCQVLVKEKIFPKAYSFAGRMRKEKKHPGAILYSLTMVAQYRPANPYPYCKEICLKESPNFYARDHQDESLQYGEKRAVQ